MKNKITTKSFLKLLQLPAGHFQLFLSTFRDWQNLELKHLQWNLGQARF